MGKYFSQDTPLAEYERLMMECPNSVRDDDEIYDDYKSSKHAIYKSRQAIGRPQYRKDDAVHMPGRL